MRLLRSILYTPGNRPDLIEKAPDSGADGLCLVLEDSVPDDRKADAREVVREAITTLSRRGAVVLAKVNPLGEGLEEDLRRIAQPGLTAIIVPRIRTAEQVRTLHDLVPGDTELLLLMETPLAVVRAYEMATASDRVAGLVCGTAAHGDMARDLGFQWTPEGLERLYLRSKVLMDARAAGREHALDGVYGRVRDIDGMVAEATFARQLGYSGKLCLSPAQVNPVNLVFTPTEAEIERAQKTVERFQQALTHGSASFVVDGEFVDYAMARTAEKVLALAAQADGSGS